MSFNAELADRLRAWRRVSGRTQAQAAAALGVVLATYVHWEHGDRMPSSGMRHVIERVLTDAGSAAVGGETTNE